MLPTGNSLFTDVGNLEHISALQCSFVDTNFSSESYCASINDHLTKRRAAMELISGFESSVFLIALLSVVKIK